MKHYKGITYMLCIILLVMHCCGCHKTSKKEDGDVSMPQSQPVSKDAKKRDAIVMMQTWLFASDEWKACHTDADRWEAVRRYVTTTVGDRVGEVSIDDVIKKQIVLLSWVSEALLCHYRDIVKHLTFSVHDLVAISEYLDNDELVRGEVDSDGIRRYMLSHYSRGQMAELWLLRLTGIRFANRKAFTEWLEAHREFLVWDAEAGVFETKEDGTSLQESRT